MFRKKMMKKRRNIYKPISLESPEHYELKGTLTEVLLILIVGIIVVLYLAYKSYHPPDPVEVQRERSTLPADPIIHTTHMLRFSQLTLTGVHNVKEDLDPDADCITHRHCRATL